MTKYKNYYGIKYLLVEYFKHLFLDIFTFIFRLLLLFILPWLYKVYVTWCICTYLFFYQVHMLWSTKNHLLNIYFYSFSTFLFLFLFLFNDPLSLSYTNWLDNKDVPDVLIWNFKGHILSVSWALKALLRTINQ